MTIWIVLGIIAAVISIICAQKVYLEVKYENAFSLKVRFLFFTFDITKKVTSGQKAPTAPKRKEEPKKYEPEVKLDEILQYLKIVYSPAIKAAKFLRKKFTFNRFWFGVGFSTGDPAATAIANGGVCAVVFSFIAALNEYFVFKDKNIAITPRFTQSCFEFYYWGILSVRLATIFIAALVFLFKFAVNVIKDKPNIKIFRGVNSNG